ncbi:hypothetical protein RHCRD62_20184 [Rhodococcus sp. RD6.2]|nr:hypothetical protein RHCRD62_20184 [Rhodococcus sp. RD6.2]
MQVSARRGRGRGSAGPNFHAKGRHNAHPLALPGGLALLGRPGGGRPRRGRGLLHPTPRLGVRADAEPRRRGLRDGATPRTRGRRRRRTAAGHPARDAVTLEHLPRHRRRDRDHGEGSRSGWPGADGPGGRR